MSRALSAWNGAAALSIPLVVCGVGALMLFGKKPYFDSFLKGARGGLESAVRLLPTLIALLVGVRMLSASGALTLIGTWLAPACEVIGLPSELLPLLLTRPFSGSGATAAYSDLLSAVGPDTFPALLASVIMGSSDTVVYIVGVYLSAVGARRARHTYICALAAMFFCIFFSAFLCRVWSKG